MLSNGILVFLFALGISLAFSEQFSYHGYRLVRLVPQTDEHIDHLLKLEHQPEIDFWTKIKGLNQVVDVLLSPEAFPIYKAIFDSINLEHEIIVHNIQDKLDEQKRSIINSKYDRTIVGKFARYSQIQSFIDEIVSENPGFASSYIAGQTYEKRNLKVLVLKTATAKRSIWLDCGIHAREWISPATCIWIIDRLVSEYKSNVASTVSLLNYFEFHIIPVLNPDGYEYTWTTYRLWRKNRRPNTGSSCVGTDLNRNSGYYWNTAGSSTQFCSDVYAGPSANSELEIKALQSAINAKLGQWDAYLTLHTYGQWWFTTWGYTTTQPANYTNILAKAKIGTEALKAVYGSTWVVGSSAAILGATSGGSEDWAQGVAKIPYAFCLELRPAQTGTDSFYGFALPEDRAPKAGEETYQGIKAFLASIKP